MSLPVELSEPLRGSRIGVFTYGMSADLTGIGTYTRALTYAMREVGTGLEIILLNPYPGSNLQWYRDFETVSVPRLQKLPAVMTVGSLMLARIASRLRLDIVHDPCGIGPFLAPRWGVRRVTTIHDAIPRFMPRSQPLLTNIVFRTLVPACRWTADAVITVSESSARDLKRYCGLPDSRLHVIYPGVDPVPAAIDSDGASALATFHQLPERARYFLAVGAKGGRKNLPTLMRALAMVREQHPDIMLVLTGSAPVETLTPGVIDAGRVDDDTLGSLYRAALGTVYVSLAEGFGFPILEAMVRGVPVITSNVSSMPEVAGEAALLVDPTDESAIAQAMISISGDDELRARLGAAGRDRAATFSWTKAAEETLRVYAALLPAQSSS
jgi:glycosyltransferase involved in cell wall biosynthesis